MITLSEQELQERLATLAQGLRNLLLSPPAIERVRLICGDYRITNPIDASLIEQLVALVLMKYISPHDLAQEINNETSVHIRDARIISDAIIKSVLVSVQADLEHAEKITESPPSSAASSDTPIQPSPHFQTPPAPPPQHIEIKPEHRKIELRYKPGVEPHPSRSAASVPQPPTASVPEPRKQSIPTPAGTPSGDAPFILHREAEFEPIRESEKPEFSFHESISASRAPEIRVQFSGGAPSKTSTAGSTPPPQQPVRYTTPFVPLRFTPRPVPPQPIVTPSTPPTPQKPVEKVVDLSAFKKSQPLKNAPGKNIGPEVEGNTVDLR